MPQRCLSYGSQKWELGRKLCKIFFKRSEQAYKRPQKIKSDPRDIGKRETKDPMGSPSTFPKSHLSRKMQQTPFYEIVDTQGSFVIFRFHCMSFLRLFPCEIEYIKQFTFLVNFLKSIFLFNFFIFSIQKYRPISMLPFHQILHLQDSPIYKN